MTMQRTQPERTHRRGSGWSDERRIDMLTQRSYFSSSDGSIIANADQYGTDLTVNPWRNISAVLSVNDDGEDILTVKIRNNRNNFSEGNSPLSSPVYSTFIFKIAGGYVGFSFFSCSQFVTGESFTVASAHQHTIANYYDSIFFKTNAGATSTIEALTHNTQTAWWGSENPATYSGYGIARIAAYVVDGAYKIKYSYANDNFSSVPQSKDSFPRFYKIFHQYDPENDELGSVESGFVADSYTVIETNDNNGYYGVALENGKLFAIYTGAGSSASHISIIEVSDQYQATFETAIREEIGEEAYAVGYFAYLGYIEILENGAVGKNTLAFSPHFALLNPVPNEYVNPPEPFEVDAGGEYTIDVVSAVSVDFVNETVSTNKTRLKFYGRKLLSEEPLGSS